LDGKVISYMTSDERATYHSLRRRAEQSSYDADECQDDQGKHHQGCRVWAACETAAGDVSRFEVAMTRKYGAR